MDTSGTFPQKLYIDSFSDIADAAQLFHCLVKPIDTQCLRPPILKMMAQHVVRRLNLGRGLSVRSRQDTECRKSVLAHGRQTKQSALLTLPTAFT